MWACGFVPAGFRAVCFLWVLSKHFHRAQVIAHMMPDLPNVGWERDLESFREFFENPAFRSDGLKVYPTLVIRGTGLYELWKQGLYRNYSPDKVRPALPTPRLCLHRLGSTLLRCRLSPTQDRLPWTGRRNLRTRWRASWQHAGSYRRLLV